jgi:hypothetical protein
MDGAKRRLALAGVMMMMIHLPHWTGSQYPVEPERCSLTFICLISTCNND